QIVASGHHSDVLSPDRIETLFKHYTAKVEAA
ncbi:metal ABC transporter ATP-binding protein, partial [Vibrio parahaemolyticus]|nr:metal ABC transporter ATP-binding protein [Vibrio parahaemolyticus]